MLLDSNLWGWKDWERKLGIKQKFIRVIVEDGRVRAAELQEPFTHFATEEEITE